VHASNSVKAFNNERGIQAVSSAPYSQWGNPAERAIQTVMNGGRANLIHGGGKEWMWGWACRHSADSANRMRPTRVVPGHEGKSRLAIMDPTVTLEKEMRTHRPFLCLVFKTLPKPELGSNFSPRAEPCVYLLYDKLKKAFAMLTIPNLYLTYSVHAKFVAGAFPLRVTNHLSNQLNTFLRPTVEEELYTNIHGPSNILRRRKVGAPSTDAAALIEAAPALARAPSSRSYNPTGKGLQSIAYTARPGPRVVPAGAHIFASPDKAAITQPSSFMQPSTTATFAVSMSAADAAAPVAPAKVLYTPDQLAARTPKGFAHCQ
jgi:hypothetical protein